MALITKPDFTYVWASGGAVVAPNDTKKQLGWVAEAPPFQYDNWLQNRQDQMLAHINQRGIPAWDGLTNYEAGGLSYVQGSDGKVYKSVAASGPSSVVSNPTTDGTDTYWTIAFADVGAFLTQATGDTRYTQRSNNLSDLTNVATARTNLALGTAATATLTTSSTDSTAGRVMRVGDFGLGTGNAPAITNANLPVGTGSGIYALYTPFTNGPSAAAVILIHQSYSGSMAQTAIEQGTLNNRMWVRQYNGSTWLPWGEIALTNSPTFTGVPSAPTAPIGTNTTQVATTAFVLSAAIGYGQTWQVVTGSRAIGTTYTNSTGRPIQVVMAVDMTGTRSYNFIVDGVAIRSVASISAAFSDGVSGVVVPAGSTYQATGTCVLINWAELR